MVPYQNWLWCIRMPNGISELSMVYHNWDIGISELGYGISELGYRYIRIGYGTIQNWVRYMRIG